MGPALRFLWLADRLGDGISNRRNRVEIRIDRPQIVILHVANQPSGAVAGQLTLAFTFVYTATDKEKPRPE
jgi:hypothetical protein